MEQFFSKTYDKLSAEGKEPRVVTKEGRDVRIFSTDFKDEIYPVVGAVRISDDIEALCSFTSSGINEETNDPGMDLYFADPEPKYRPYESAEECFKDVVKHGGWVKHKRTGARMLITWINCDCVLSGSNVFSYNELIDHVYADDETPCGVKEEE